ncbi:MAG: transposase [Pirellulales bacterium]|nr:transposase [Pirellulales bacterium]
MKWSTFRRQVSPIRREFNSLLVRGSFSGNPKLIGFCKELLSNKDWLWTFTRIEGIEPTNNEAERCLRPAVIHRKLTFGTQSDSGSRFLERIMTISETCRRQQRSAYEFLVEAMKASFTKQPAPSLLPNETEPIAA